MLIKTDDAFARTINANANVAAYLKSLFKVEEMQDQVLQATGLKELRDETSAPARRGREGAGGGTTS